MREINPDFDGELAKLRRVGGDRIIGRKYEDPESTREYALEEAKRVAAELLDNPEVKGVGVFGSVVAEDREFPKDLDLVVFVPRDLAFAYYKSISRIGFGDQYQQVGGKLSHGGVSRGKMRDRLEGLVESIRGTRQKTTQEGLSARPTDIILIPESLDRLDATLMLRYVNLDFLQNCLENCRMYNPEMENFDTEMFPPVKSDVWDLLQNRRII